MNNIWSQWFKASGSTTNCVEHRTRHNQYQIRDSKLGDASPKLTLSARDHAALRSTVA